MSRIFVTILVALIAAVFGSVAARSDGAAMDVPCWFDIPDGEAADCYRVMVPVRYDDETAGTMSLPVAVLKARNAIPEPDPVVLIQGGPGASFFYTDYPADGTSTYWWKMTAPVRQNRDILIYDQRGVGLAEPNLNCFEADEKAGSAEAPPGIETEFFDREQDEIRRCYDRLVADGIDLAAFSTPASADDLALMVRALGYKRVNLWGMSYGTRVGLVTLRRHPDLVRAAVLDGVYPPHIRADESTPWATHRVFARVFDDCARDPWCARAYGDVGEKFVELLESMNEDPQAIAVGSDDRWPDGSRVLLDGDLLIFHMYDALYFGEAIPYVPALVSKAVGGDLDELGWFYWYPFIADWSLDEGAFLSVTCREEQPRIRPDVLAEGGDLYGVYGSAGAMIATSDICDDWPVPPLAPDEWEPVKSDVPVLLSGAYDPVTPPDWAADTANYLPNSRHFEFLGAGHVPSGADTCAARYVAAFFDDPDPASLTPPDCPLFLNPADFSSVDW